MRINKIMLATAVLGAQATGLPLLADQTSDDISALKHQIQALTEKVLTLEKQAAAQRTATTAEGSAKVSGGEGAGTDAKVEQLDQKVRIIERKAELDQDVAAERSKTATKVSLGANGFSVSSADTNFVFKVRGYVQVDARGYVSERVDTAANDTFLIRRARPILEGTTFGKLDYRVMLDFGAQSSLSTANNALLQDGYVNARLVPEFQIQAGKFKEPVGLERLQSGANLLFIERAYPTQLVPNRDVGVQLQGDLFQGALRYETGLFNGVADGGSGDFDATDREKDFAGRLFAQPFRASEVDALRGLGLGVAGTFGNHEGALRPFVSDGLQRFFTYRTSTDATKPNVLGDGNQWRLAPQAYYYWGPFGLLAEYVVSSSEVRQAGGGTGAGLTQRLDHTGWQVAASYFLTGDANAFRPVAPKHAVDFKGGGWGALELAARVSQLEVDDAAFPVFADPSKSANEALSFGVGLNWHLNRNLKLSLNYEHTDFKAAAGNPFETQAEDLILTRVQFGF